MNQGLRSVVVAFQLTEYRLHGAFVRESEFPAQRIGKHFLSEVPDEGRFLLFKKIAFQFFDTVDLFARIKRGERVLRRRPQTPDRIVLFERQPVGVDSVVATGARFLAPVRFEEFTERCPPRFDLGWERRNVGGRRLWRLA